MEITVEIKAIDAPSKVATMAAAITSYALFQSNFMINVLANQPANAEANRMVSPWQAISHPMEVEAFLSSVTPLMATILATNIRKPVIPNKMNVTRAETTAGRRLDTRPP